MQPQELKRILTAFATTPSDVDVRQGKAVAQIQDELIDVAIERDPNSGEMIVVDNDIRYPPLRWVCQRVAKLPLLADRILTLIPPIDSFVTPSGALQDSRLSESDSDQELSNVIDGLEDIAFKQQIIGTSSVIYLTSDAGEGKTTVINDFARRQAESYRARKSQALLIPIPLGGKAFLHFDDVVIATLVNRYRFNYYWYEGFIELVKLGAIVPAFDGFEEMFIEGSSTEAVSALGNLINTLDSSGTVIVAARKAFFEYLSFRTQAKLFDSMGDKSVSFSRIKINRWGKSQFIDYGVLRGSNDAEEIFNLVATRFGTEHHPLLTRAVLVRRLFDIALTLKDTEELLRCLGTTPQDYFFNFVDALVSREANEKWMDKSGDAQEPLIHVSEHHELLSQIAREMWYSSSYSLRHDVVDTIVDLFCDTHSKTPSIRRQIKERIKQHSLLVAEAGKANSLRFDHDDFRLFYLGEALGRSLVESDRSDVLTLVSANQLAPETSEQALQYLRRHESRVEAAINLLIDLARSESSLSYAKENCGALLIRCIDGRANDEKLLTVNGLTFPSNSLTGRRLSNVKFKNCYFQPTSIEGLNLSEVEFKDCEFERLEIGSETQLNQWRLDNCTFSGLVSEESDLHLFGPNEIRAELLARNANFSDSTQSTVSLLPQDPEIKMVEKFLRLFLRRTQVDEIYIRKIGRANSAEFLNSVLPDLIKVGIVEDVPYRGSGTQRRFRILAGMQKIQEALSSCEGSYALFLKAFK